MTKSELDKIASVKPDWPGRSVPGWDFMSKHAPMSVLFETYERLFGFKVPDGHGRPEITQAVAALNVALEA